MSKVNWKKHLDDAEKRGHFSVQEMDYARSWTTCAIGEHTADEKKKLIMYFNMGVPQIETTPNKLGLDFMNYVSDNMIPEARDTYNQIQEWFEKELSV